MEPEEQDYLEAKITDLSLGDISTLSQVQKENLFQAVMDYATKFLRAAWVRKHYFSNFWEKLETITTLEKEDIYGTKSVEEGGGQIKIGERYRPASSFLSTSEPAPKNLDGDNLLKFKLFFHFWEQPLNGRSNFDFLKNKLNFEYGPPIDSGRKPKKRKRKEPDTGTPPSENKTLDQVREQAIQEIKNYIDILKGQNYWGSLDMSDEWYQWEKRYRKALEKSRIIDLKKADLNWLYRFSAKKAIMKSLATNGLSIEILRIRDDNLSEHLKSFDGQSLIETEKNRLLDLINNYGNNKDREIDEAIKFIEQILREKGLEGKASQILGSKWKEDFQGLLEDSEIEDKKRKIITKINDFVNDEGKEKEEAIAVIKQKLEKLGLSEGFLGNWRDNFTSKNKEEIEIEKNRLLKLIDEEINRKEKDGEITSDEAKEKRKDLIDETKKDVTKKVREELKKGHQKLALEEKDLPPQLFAPFKNLEEKLDSFENLEEVTEWEQKLLSEVKKGKEVKLTNIKNEAIEEIKKELNTGNYELGKNQDFEEVIKGMVDPDDIEKKKLDILKLISEQKSAQVEVETPESKTKPTPSVWPKRIGIGALVVIVASLVIFTITKILKKPKSRKG